MLTRVSGILVGFLALAMVTGCYRGRRAPSGGPREGQGPAGRQTIHQTGSTTMLPVAEKWHTAFNIEHPEIEIVVSGGGTEAGLKALISETAEIADSSRELEPAEIQQAKAAQVYLLATKVARDGVVVIVNPANPMRAITLELLSDIYSGKVKDWGQAGVSGLGAIELVSRDPASGTRKLFKDVAVTLKGRDKGRDYAPKALEQTSSEAVLTLVSQSKNAIGYVGLGYVNKTVRPLDIIVEEGQEPIPASPGTVRDGTYPLARDLYCVTNGEPTGAVRTYLDWVQGPRGQVIVEQTGYVPLIAP